MAGPSRRSNPRQFFMPPASTPETTLPPDVAAVYEDMRRFRREIENERKIIMTAVTVLAGNVQRLIDVATSIKHERDTAPVPTPQGDDPAIEDLNRRITAAIDVLTGVASPMPEPAPLSITDPNAPVANIP